MGFLSKLFSTGAEATVGRVLDGIDKLSTSGEERASLRVKALNLYLDAQMRGIEADSKSGGLAGQWRPIMALVLVGVLVWHVVAATFGFPVPDLNMDEKLWTTLQVMVGGYAGGRSVEKIVKTIANKGKKT